MNMDDPYEDLDKDGDSEKESSKPKQKQKSQPSSPNLYSDLGEEDEVEGDEDPEDLDSEDDDYEEDEVPWYKNIKVLIVLFIASLIVVAIVYFFFLKEEPPPPPPTATEEQEPVNQVDALKDELYQLGIGKEAINEVNIYEQGPIESSDFRKDFVNTDSAENYKQPVTIVAVNDSVSYIKHRTMTDDGMDMYWVDAEYKSKKTRFTMPYYIWQTLAPQGVMDVIVEVVTDADGKRFVASITPVPPSKGE